jgi:hypothetical protein
MGFITTHGWYREHGLDLEQKEESERPGHRYQARSSRLEAHSRAGTRRSKGAGSMSSIRCATIPRIERI